MSMFFVKDIFMKNLLMTLIIAFNSITYLYATDFTIRYSFVTNDKIGIINVKPAEEPSQKNGIKVGDSTYFFVKDQKLPGEKIYPISADANTIPKDLPKPQILDAVKKSNFLKAVNTFIKQQPTQPTAQQQLDMIKTKLLMNRAVENLTLALQELTTV